MFRSSLLKAVYDALNSHPYISLEDFNVEETQNKKKEPCLSIVYRYTSSQFFRFHIPNAKQKRRDEDWAYYPFNCTMNPGEESAEETHVFDERKGLLAEIQAWVKRLYEDIVSAAIVRQFEAQSSVLEHLRERLEELPDEPLSSEDIKEFRDGLEQIKTDFTSQLKEEIADKEQPKQKVEELSRDIEFLKRTLESMTKRKWGEIFSARARKWLEKTSLRRLASGARVSQNLLPNISDELSIVADIVEQTPPSDSSPQQ